MPRKKQNTKQEEDEQPQEDAAATSENTAPSSEAQKQGVNFEPYKQEILQHVTQQVQNVYTAHQELQQSLTTWMQSADKRFDEVTDLIDKYGTELEEQCDKRHNQSTEQVKQVAATQAQHSLTLSSIETTQKTHTSLLDALTTSVAALIAKQDQLEKYQLRSLQDIATVKTLVIALIVLLVALFVQTYIGGNSCTSTVIQVPAASDHRYTTAPPSAQPTIVPAPALVYMSGTYDKRLELAANVAKRLRKLNINVQFTEKDTGKQKHQVFWKLNSSSRGLSLSDVPSGKDVILIVLHLDGCPTFTTISHPNHVQFCISDTDLTDDAVNELQLQELALLLNK